MGALWTVAVVWGFICTALAPFAPRGSGLWFVLAGWAPAALLMWFVFARAGRRESAHEAMLKAAGIAPAEGFDYAEGQTGIGVNRAARTLALMAGGSAKVYPYADVRTWESNKERAGRMVGVGFHAGLAAIGENARAEREARENTGLFVTVKDIDHPKWRIEMRDPQTQARCMEILRQEINEGGVAA